MASGASGSGIFGVNTDCNVYGCMDSFATNYSADANTDDGTCEYDCQHMQATMLCVKCMFGIMVILFLK